VANLRTGKNMPGKRQEIQTGNGQQDSFKSSLDAKDGTTGSKSEGHAGSGLRHAVKCFAHCE